eukprot:Sspe_Gene.32870::Locus_16090_Transcript_1_2_Confidence_0.500_Length_4544::g.32870::m.32870
MATTDQGRQVRFTGDETRKRKISIANPDKDDHFDKTAGLVYDESSSSEDDTYRLKLGVDETRQGRRKHGRWIPLKYKKPIRPIPGHEGVGKRYCPPPMALASLVAFPLEKKVVLFGGVADTAPTNSLWVHNLETKKWTVLEPGGANEGEVGSPRAEARRHARDRLQARGENIHAFPAPRCGHQAVALTATEMVIFGGADISRARYYNDMWLFDMKSYTWRELSVQGVPPCPRWLFTMTAVESRIFIYGGESARYEILGDLHVYDHDPFGEVTLTVSAPPSQKPDRVALTMQKALQSDNVKGELSKMGLSMTDLAVTPKGTTVSINVVVSRRVSEVNLTMVSAVVLDAVGATSDMVLSQEQVGRQWIPLRT